MTPGIASQPIPSVICSHSQQPNCHPKPYNAQPVPSIAYGLNPSQWQFPPESLNAIPSSNSLPNTAFPTSQNFIAPLYQNSLHHPIAAQPSALTGSGPTWILTQPVQTVPSYSAQPIGNLTTKELANLLTVSRKDPLPEWKLSNFDGNPLDWNEWFGQFRSAVDASPLSDDVKMTYLKTLVSGKAKNAIEGFAYCGAMYKDALRALERKFGQPQTVVSAHLDKLSAYPPVKMHSSENVIQYASLVASLVAVFQSLGYNADLNSSSLLNQAVSKLPPNLKESWSFQTVKRNLLRPTLLDFNSWIQEKAEAHDRMLSTSKSKLDSSVATSIKPKTTKTFSSTAQNRESDPCVLCNGKHPLFKCPVFKEKTPTQRAKFAPNRSCVSLALEIIITSDNVRVLSGPVPSTVACPSTCFTATSEQSDELAQVVKSWYDLESYGTYKTVDSKSQADARAMDILESTTFCDGVRYHVGMLWADSHSTLPNNYYASLAQLKSLEKRLKNDPSLNERYAKTITDDLDKGYIRVVSSEELASSTPREWYLPHHPVLNPNKPNKVRRVLNGAALFRGHSLNKALLTGPDLLQNLLKSIIRFRENVIAVCADIEGMFLQVGVLPDDQPSLRFLWREDPTSDVVVYQYMRHIFGSKDSPTCANYALQRTGHDNYDKFPKATQAVLTKFYMDDYLDSFSTAEEAIEVSQELVKLLQKGGFKLTKFGSNNKIVLEAISRDSEVDEGTETHILGLKWNRADDILTVSRFLNPNPQPCLTQRVVLKCVASVFDPIGIVAPFTIQVRLWLKEIWKLHGLQWDTEIPGNIANQFIRLSQSLPLLGELKLPRSYFACNVDALELHVFGDSSQDAFAAVAYLRAKVRTADGSTSFKLAFVFGKARVAPIKALSIPKLELQAVLLAARIKVLVVDALTIQVQRVYMWTDSTTVLHWLQSTSKQSVFVANRIAEILDLTTIDQWNHVSTNNNPADIATRRIEIHNLQESSWLKGPTFLLTEELPLSDLQSLTLNTTVLSTAENEVSLVSNFAGHFTFLDWKKFSSFTKYLRIVACMLRFCKASTPSDKEHPLIVTAPEREQAMIKLWLLSQKESFPKEMQTLGEGKSMLKNSIIVNHSPFLGPRGLIRSTGRIKHLTVIDFDTKHPIILDSRHSVVLKFLIETHENNHHQGVEYVRALVQRKYAILKLRSTLRSIQRNCVTCRKFRAKPPTPIMSDLPKERLGYKLKPFTFTGVDYFGPLYVTVRRSTQKRWGFLFTCLTTRATHIEIAHSLDADSCIMGVERFMARRGKPKVIWSDNGTNFVGAEKELLGHLKSVDQHRIKSKMSQNGIFWKFNPPATPHQGGAWERLVQSSKRLFYKILGNRRLTDEVLSTVFCLVEQFLNARPLVPASSDVTDLEALTPNHFLLGEVTSLPSFESSKGLDRHDHRR